MDTSKFLGKFRDATREHVERLNALILQLEMDPERSEDVKDLMREVHTLKGEARMMGFADMADVAHAIEDLLKQLEGEGFRTLTDRSDLLFEAFDAELRLLSERLGEEAPPVDVPALCARLRGEATSGLPPALPTSPPAAPSLPEAPGARPEPAGAGAGLSFGDDPDLATDDAAADLPGLDLPAGSQSEAEAGLAAAFGRPVGAPPGEASERAAAAPPVVAPAPPAGSPRAGAAAGGGGFATSKFLGKFRDATRDHLERMNSLVLQVEMDPSRREDVKDLLREVHTLKGESRMMGFGEMAELAHAIEDALKREEGAGFSRLAERSDELFAAFDAMGALLAVRLDEAAPDVDLAALTQTLRAESGAESGAALPSQPHARERASPPSPALVATNTRSPTQAPSPTRAPLDPLVARSFAAVLADHLALARAASSVPLLREVVRALEGDARLAGFTDLARLAQGVLDALPADDGASVPPAARVALEASATLAAQEAAGGPTEAALAEILGHVADETGARSPPSVPAPVLAPSPSPASVLVPVPDPAPASAPARPSRPSGASAPDSRAQVDGPRPAARDQGAAPAALVAPPAERRATAQVTQAARPEETVRLALSKLEELGNLSGDIYLNHSRSEERQRRLRGLLVATARQSRSLAVLRDLLAARGGLTGDAALREAWESVQGVARQVRSDVRSILRRDHDESMRSGHSVVDLRERVRALQMLPAATLFEMYPRMVRDIAKSLGKRVRFQADGAHAELDRRILDEIRDPMVHLIRNAIDHGIETPEQRTACGKPAEGTVTLSARTEGDHVVIEVADDGGGMDPTRLRQVAVTRGVLTEEEAEALSDEAALQLVFAAGFSSKEDVSDLSGRGVGLDVVRDRVERLEGRISLTSTPGRGTSMALRLPLTLALARVLLVRAGGLVVALPCPLVEEVLVLDADAIRRVETYEAMEWHGRTLPLVSLAHVLERPAEPPKESVRRVAVLAFEGQVVGFVVDEFVGEREVVVKRLDAFLGHVRNVAGATLLASGDIVAVLHVPQLIASTMGVSPVRLQARIREADEPLPERARARRVLVVDDSIIVRDMMKGVLDAAGFDVTLAVDGLDGLEKQLDGSFDLVITDVEMPRMDGFELTRSLKQNERHAAVPVIIVTTLDSAESREKGLRMGASAYVVKNLLDMSLLVSTIERLVA